MQILRLESNLLWKFNSDLTMIKLMYKWLIVEMNIKKIDMIMNLAINVSHKNRENEILKYWSNLLDYKLEDFWYGKVDY